MGKVNIVTREQYLLLDEFRRDQILSNSFYFTGGTALALYYLKHRQSVDLDFFSKDKFDPLLVSERINDWAKNLKLKVEYTPREITHPFLLTFKNRKSVKVDFSYHPYQQVEKTNNFDGINVDSLLDIAVNKLLVVEQRTQVKDFVDLYFLLRKFTIWDLMEGVRAKFRMKLDPFIIASDFFKVEAFDYLPTMIKPLKLAELKKYFITRAKKLGQQSTK